MLKAESAKLAVRLDGRGAQMDNAEADTLQQRRTPDLLSGRERKRIAQLLERDFLTQPDFWRAKAHQLRLAAQLDPGEPAVDLEDLAAVIESWLPPAP